MKQFLQNVCPRTLTLRSLAVLFMILALVLALVVQQRKAATRVRTLRYALAEAHAIRAADERVQNLLGDRAIFILKTATRVETLSVGRGPGYPRTPTGVDLGTAAATRLRLALLDPHNYLYLDADDMPEPQAGFRFRDGDSSLDVLVSLESFNLTSVHEDIWVILNYETDQSHYLGCVCMYSKQLNDLLVTAMRLNGSH